VSSISPAIVAQKAVARLPRRALILLCLAYVLPGFVARNPWKNADLEAFGFMLALARPESGQAVSWLKPLLAGQAEPSLALLPLWLGAWCIRLAPPGWEALAARLPFMVMLALTLAATWQGVYALARTRAAQPVAFAFGGEAHPADYARTLADGGVLALLGCLGLALLSHEITPALSQLCFTSLLFYGLTTTPRQRWVRLGAAAAGLLGLTLSGAPTMAVLLGAGGWLVHVREQPDPNHRSPRMLDKALLVLFILLSITLAGALDLWRWRLQPPAPDQLHSFARLLLWFTWPAGPLALWSLWRWRRQLLQGWRMPHIGLPLWFVLVTVGTTWFTGNTNRALLSALPAIATLAAFALPTMRRSVGAFIDWFTLLFFSLGALIIWVVWVAMQTGTPAVTARNVVREAPDFVPSLSLTGLAIAAIAFAGWLALVRWRTSRHRIELWKSLVLPAAGVTLCWLLLMTLWLPLLDHRMSYGPLLERMRAAHPDIRCVQTVSLNNAQNAALRHHGPWHVRVAGAAHLAPEHCRWLVTSSRHLPHHETQLRQWGWTEVARYPRPSDSQDIFVLLAPAQP
jgi:hypothetical protein